VVAARKLSKANPEINAFMRNSWIKITIRSSLALVGSCRPALPSY